MLMITTGGKRQLGGKRGMVDNTQLHCFWAARQRPKQSHPTAAGQ